MLGLTACTALPNAAPPREELSDRAFNAPLDDAANAHPSGFDRKLFLVLLDDKTHPSLRGGRSLWATSEDISYRPSNGDATIKVPKGFVTDLASIPQPFWSLLPPDGPWAKAAVIHDFLYYTQGSGVWKCHASTIIRKTDYTRPEADWILRDAMADRGVDAFHRNVIYLAVRFGGQRGWDASPGRNAEYCRSKPATPAH
ncbi:DUF1353 domain-containing protein [Phenylobacterium sp.]|uniref:DUF1353 domain-containing protein n=1 Tax=Phenylobacterium sp. TaxID=1871053 RepID=UPI0025D5E7CA|nr:DUF1353 domain-containing protein [Phenylobacterium sp.]